MYLKDLFPEYLLGRLPLIVRKLYDYVKYPNLKNLQQIINNQPTHLYANSAILQRGNFVFGWLDRDIIQVITPPSRELNHVFDRISNCFVKLTSDEMQIMGMKRRISFVDTLAKLGDSFMYGYTTERLRVNLQSSKYTFIPSNKQTFRPPLNHTDQLVNESQTLKHAFEQSIRHTMMHTMNHEGKIWDKNENHTIKINMNTPRKSCLETKATSSSLI